MADKIQSDYGKNNSFATMLKSAATRTVRDTNIADLYVVKSISRAFDRYGIAVLERLCQENGSYVIPGYFFYEDLAVGDVVLGVLTNRDFRDVIALGNEPRAIAAGKPYNDNNCVIIRLN